MVLSKVLLLLAFALCVFAHQCKFNSTNGFQYDLFEIRQLGDLRITTLTGTYYYQACSEVVAKCGTSASSVCLKNGGNEINQGSTSTARWYDRDDKEDEGFTIIYTDGDVCGTNQNKRRTIVNLICNINSNLVVPQSDPFITPSKIEKVEELDDCVSVLTVTSPFACATNRKQSNTSSGCNIMQTKDDCFSSNIEGSCSCSWCVESNKCLAMYEPCEGPREFGCSAVVKSSFVGVIVFLIGSIIFIILICLCICTCLRREKARKLMLVRKGLQHPASFKRDQGIVMEPLLHPGSEQFHQMSPQFVYVQVPMQGTDQHQPPYFAPQPFFLAPQYIQPNVE